MLSEENASSTAFIETQDSTEKLKRWIFVGLFRNWPIKTWNHGATSKQLWNVLALVANPNDGINCS